MILTLVNLPFTVKYSDIKTLVQAKCGIHEIILDNLMPHDNRTKKVTVGLADTEDAAIFMSKLDGYYWNGHRLQVIQKAKSQSSANSNQESYSGSTNSMQNYRPQGSKSGQKYRPEGRPQETSSGQNYRPQGSNSGHKYRPEGRPQETSSVQNYRPRGSSSDQNYRPRESSSDQNYRPRGSSSDQESKSLQNYRPQESSWAAQSFDSLSTNMMSQSVPVMVPAPTSFEGYNYQAAFNQSAYYLMNQPGYANQTTSATQSMTYQYPGISYGNMGVWNQQQQSSGMQQSAQQGQDQESKWNIDRDSARDSNRGSDRWSDDRQPAWDNNRESEQEECKREDDHDFRGRNEHNSRERHDHDSRGRIDHDSRGRNDRDPRGRNDRDPRGTNDRDPRGTNDRDPRGRNDRDPRGRNDRDPRGRIDRDSRGRSDRDSRGRNDRDSGWGNNRDSRYEIEAESRWGNNGDSRVSRRDNNRDSKWDSEDNSNRDSYPSNQTEPSRERDQAGPSHNRDSYNRNEPKYTQPTAYGDHVSGFSQKKEENNKWGPRDDCNEGNRWGSRDPPVERQSRERRRQPPPAKRQRVPDFSDGEPPQKKTDFGDKKEFQFKKPMPDQKFKQPPNREHFQIPTGPNASPLEEKAHLLRLQLSTELAKEILNDKRFEWEAPDKGALTVELKNAIRRRIDIMLQDDYNIKMKHMRAKYSIKFNTHNMFSHYLLFRRILKECGGKMITKMAPPAKKPPRTRPQKARKLAAGVFGNLTVDHRYEPPGEKKVSLTAQQLPPPVQTKIGKPMVYPRTKIPKPKLSQPPEGDRTLHMQQKKVASSLLNDDYVHKLMSAVNPAIAKAINKEVDPLIPVIEGAFEETSPIAIQFAEMGRAYTGTTMRRLLKINIARRILGVKPIVVRIFATPMVKRPPLEQFLNKYNVSTLKRSVKKPYYVASLETVADHDKLCNLRTIKIAGCQVTFKPFHFAGNKDKITDADIKRQRRSVKREHLRHSELAIKHYNIENGFKQTEPEDDYIDKGGNSEYEDDLQEMFDEINDNEQDFTTDVAPEEEENIINTAEELIAEIKGNDGDVSCEEVEANISSVDLTRDDDDIDEMIDNLNEDLNSLPTIEDRSGEVTDIDNDNTDDNVAKDDENLAINDENVAKEDNESSDVNAAEDINIADLDDDDLEDW